MESEYGDFIVKLIETLDKNGFPEKKVSLPLEKMYEVAHEKGLNFNKVLEFLKEKNIFHEKTDEKLIFFEKPKEPEPEAFDPSKIFESLGANKDQLSDLLAKGQDLLKHLPKQQIDMAMKMFANMSDEQKAEMVKKVSDLGIFNPPKK